jgi:hypothetical protein
VKFLSHFFIRNFVLVLTLFTSVSFAQSHKLRVSDPSLANSMKARGGKLIADYGGFQVIEMDQASLTSADTNRAELADDFNFVRLNAGQLDTRTPGIKARRKAVGGFNGKKLHLIQFAGPVKPEWMAALEQTGVKIVSYIPENTYLVSGNAKSLSQMQSWTGATNIVQWEGDYADDFKIHPRARNKDAAGQPRNIGTDEFAVQLVVDAEANPATLALIHSMQLAPARHEYNFHQYHNLTVHLPAERLPEIAAMPDVISIQPYAEPKKHDERQDQILAGNLTGNFPSGPGYLDWLASKGFTQTQFDASGFAVDVSDSGLDNGTTTPGHFALYTSGNILEDSRVIYNRLEGTPSLNSTLVGCDGHGPLNAHIIGGYDNYTGFQHADSAGFRYGLGVCPFVKLGSSVIFDPDNYTNPNFSDLQSDAYESGARISNNSWGSAVRGIYNSDCQTYDALVRDAQPGGSTFATAGNQPMVIVFVSGNEGPNAQTINSPGSAKNVITIGGSENVRSLNLVNGGNDASGSDACGELDTNADNANDLMRVSSRGPCRDGRMKPDLIAPGSHITGGVPQNSPPPSPSGLGSAISCFNGTGVCALPGSGGIGNPDNFFPLGQQFYTVSSGTSHAAPAVSGACALLRQYFINNSFAPPSPAMTKAWLMASARYMTGSGANDTLWSPNQGMGEVNLNSAFEGLPIVLRDQVTADKFTASGQTRTFNGTLSDTNKSLRLTLAWTDAPGNTSGNAYNNNLNLTLTIGGKTYKGNVFKGQYSITGGLTDSKNNVENIFLPPGVVGDFTITVTAANINSDGVPNEAPSLDQDFALVALEVTSPPAPFAPAAATYSGLFSEPGNVQLISSGSIAIKTTTAGTYSGTLLLGGKRFSFSGHFNADGSATNTIPRAGSPSLTFVLQSSTDNAQINGTLTDGNWIADAHAIRSVFSKTNPTPLAGRYTLIIPGTNDDAALPGGDGYGTVTMTSAGQIKLKGVLADGTKISQSATLSSDGQWPFHLSLYSGAGEIFGWLTVANTSDEDLGGAVAWIKNANSAAKFYPSGFYFQTHATGSIYNPLAVPLLNIGSGHLIFTGGNLSHSITNNVTLNGNKIINQSPNALSLTISSSGLFKGTVVNPDTTAKISFNGVILQKQDFGSGYFLGTDQGGRVFLGP